MIESEFDLGDLDLDDLNEFSSVHNKIPDLIG